MTRKEKVGQKVKSSNRRWAGVKDVKRREGLFQFRVAGVGSVGWLGWLGFSGSFSFVFLVRLSLSLSFSLVGGEKEEKGGSCQSAATSSQPGNCFEAFESTGELQSGLLVWGRVLGYTAATPAASPLSSSSADVARPREAAINGVLGNVAPVRSCDL